MKAPRSILEAHAAHIADEATMANLRRASVRCSAFRINVAHTLQAQTEAKAVGACEASVYALPAHIVRE